MKRIILVSNTSWYLYNFRLGVIKLLQQNGFEITCIANTDAYTEKLKAEGINYIASSLRNQGTQPLQELTYLRFLLVTYKKIKPVFIFHYTIKPNIYGSIAAKMVGIKSIAVVSGAGYVFIRDSFLNRTIKNLYKLAAKACSEMWFVNKEDQELFTKENIISKTQVTKVLPGEGINTTKFKRCNAYHVNGGSFNFLLSGRMLWDKGVGVFADAARRVKTKYPHVNFQLLGFLDVENPSAISRRQMEEWQAAGYIQYLGVTDNVKTFLENAHCFVLPTYYREGVPRALLEAASFEIPLIATDNVGCREVIYEGYNGLLCKVKDAEDLASKMETIVTMKPPALKQMGENGRKKVVEEFEETLVLEYYKKVIDRLF